MKRACSIAGLLALTAGTAAAAVQPASLFQDNMVLRREVGIPADWVGKTLTLRLGPIDDADFTYVNGRPVGSLTSSDAWLRPREYTVPGEFVPSETVTIAVRVLNTFGAAGLFGEDGEYAIFPKGAGTWTPISLAGEWAFRLGSPTRSWRRRSCNGKRNGERDMRSSEAGARMKWLQDAKFGLFIHWGPSSVAGSAGNSPMPFTLRASSWAGTTPRGTGATRTIWWVTTAPTTPSITARFGSCRIGPMRT